MQPDSSSYVVLKPYTENFDTYLEHDFFFKAMIFPYMIM